jgi:hypothetical protein
MHVASYFEAIDSVAVEVVAHIFKALFFPPMTPPNFAKPAKLFDWTVMQLRKLSR